MGYLGSKAASGVFQAIIALMPPHDTFIDLFAGSGVITKRKPECLRSYAVDIDASVVDALPALPRLTRVKSDARSFLDKFDYAAAGRLLIYADPPYVHSTRTSRHRYKHEMTDRDHVDLLCQLRTVPASVILSGYPNALYDANLLGWRTMEFQAMTRGGVRTEKLWFNFEPSLAYSALYAGRNFTDRQRIKRKAQRWAANYLSMPAGERLAVLSALLSADTATDDSGCRSAKTSPLLELTKSSASTLELPFTESSLFPVYAAGPIDSANLQGRCNTLQVTSILRKRGSFSDR